MNRTWLFPRQNTHRRTPLRLVAGFIALYSLLAAGIAVGQGVPSDNPPASGRNGKPIPRTMPKTNTIMSIKAVPIQAFDAQGQLHFVGNGVAIELYSPSCFPITNDIWTLNIGQQQFTTGHYANSLSLNTLIFTLTTDDFAKVATGDAVSVQQGSDGSGQSYRFGKLNKAMLDKALLKKPKLKKP